MNNVEKELVYCEICHKGMTVINNKHLASHNLTAKEYKEKFPNAKMMTDTSAKKLSERSIKSNESRKGKPRSEIDKQHIKEGVIKSFKEGRVVHNKGVAMSEEQKQKLSDIAKKQYENGRITHTQGKHLSEETKQKISNSLIGIKQDPSIAIKAIQTKRERGYDLAVFRGKHHSEETKKLISKKVKEKFDSTKKERRQHYIERIKESNLTLLNEITEDYLHLKCNVCGHEFTRHVQIFDTCRYNGKICDQCFPLSPVSKQEKDLRNYIEIELQQHIIHNDREIIYPLELDIVIPDKKIAIEYCGLYWHSELAGKLKFYHKFKYDKCIEKGYKLITVFEDEWINKQDIVESMLKNALDCNMHNINARDCEIKELNSKETSIFLNDNHIQGNGNSKEKYGLFYNGILMSVMTFSDKNISRKLDSWEINRYATLKGYRIVGGASKLFSYFINKINPWEVISYSDLRYGEGNVYGKLNFIKKGNSIPNYWYFDNKVCKRIHRYALRKQLNEDKDKTEWELRKEQGYNRIWDCGHAKWIWKTNKY